MQRTMKKSLLVLAAAMLFSVPVQAQTPKTLIPVGAAVGISLETDEVVIAALSETVTAAKDAGLRPGDILLKINDKTICSTDDVAEAVKQSAPQCTVCYERGGVKHSSKVCLAKTTQGQALGIYVRSSIEGIGTVTYYDPADGSFGALGHGVTDNLSQKRLHVTEGAVYNATVAEIRKGGHGKPGALRGMLGTLRLGTVKANTGLGVFGTLDTFIPEHEAVEVASWRQVHTGQAEILSSLDGERAEYYRVRITELNETENDTKNFLLRVEDDRLLAQTGGIVQGMSGSPILQDGRIIGAVTHVMIDDPTTGYGVFIGNMLHRAEKIQKAA
ncbi:MAG: PDZ domain-containing protein [Clostridia bacterium]|nr:PDZ domain-containing protein [Clostridia bacterium]